MLVPVPLHPKRLRERGYNQASLLSKELGKLVGLPVEDDTLIRVKDSVPQARTRSAIERRRNVQDAFASHQRLEGKQILLIDDVCTTGATLDACATALKAAGAGSVWGLTVAREMFSLPPK
jgi:ComF family protein